MARKAAGKAAKTVKRVIQRAGQEVKDTGKEIGKEVIAETVVGKNELRQTVTQKIGEGLDVITESFKPKKINNREIKIDNLHSDRALKLPSDTMQKKWAKFMYKIGTEAANHTATVLVEKSSDDFNEIAGKITSLTSFKKRRKLAIGFKLFTREEFERGKLVKKAKKAYKRAEPYVRKAIQFLIAAGLIILVLPLLAIALKIGHAVWFVGVPVSATGMLLWWKWGQKRLAIGLVAFSIIGTILFYALNLHTALATADTNWLIASITLLAVIAYGFCAYQPTHIIAAAAAGAAWGTIAIGPEVQKEVGAKTRWFMNFMKNALAWDIAFVLSIMAIQIEKYPRAIPSAMLSILAIVFFCEGPWFRRVVIVLASLLLALSVGQIYVPELRARPWHEVAGEAIQKHIPDKLPSSPPLNLNIDLGLIPDLLSNLENWLPRGGQQESSWPPELKYNMNKLFRTYRFKLNGADGRREFLIPIVDNDANIIIKQKQSPLQDIKITWEAEGEGPKEWPLYGEEFPLDLSKYSDGTITVTPISGYPVEFYIRITWSR